MKQYTVTILIKGGGSVNYSTREDAVNHHATGIADTMAMAAAGDLRGAWRVTSGPGGTGHLIAVVPGKEIAAFYIFESGEAEQREFSMVQLEIAKIQKQLLEKTLKDKKDGDDWKIPEAI